MLRAFRHRDFTLYAFSGLISNIGLWFQRTGVQWLTWSLTESYAWLGAIAMAEAITVTFCLPLFGTVVDRANRLHLARISQVIMIALAGVFATLTILDWISVWILFGLMMLNGISESFWTPIRMSMAPSLVPRDDLSSAIGIGSIFFNVAQFAGPAIAGIIIHQFAVERVGIGYLFALNGLSFFGYLFVLFKIQLREQDRSKSRHGRFFSDFKDGLIYLTNKAGLGLFMLWMLASTFILRSYRELLAGLAGGLFDQGASGFAFLQSAAGAGAIVGSILVASSSRVTGMTRFLFVAAFLAVAFLLTLSVATHFWMAVIIVAAMSCVSSYIGIGGQVLVQSAIHGAVRGRVMSLWSVSLRAGPSSGAWTIGLFTGIWHIQAVLAGAALLYFAVLLAIFRRRQHLAENMESPPTDELPAGLSETSAN